MLDPSLIGRQLKALGFDFYSGVPCSFLKGLVNFAIQEADYVAAANEGDAVAICAGTHLGGRRSVVLMQNSGLCNAVSPLTSLNATFRIPVLGFVSLRGQAGIKDEPQHELMGTITTRLLDTMGMAWEFLSEDTEEASAQLARAARHIDRGETFFFVVRKNTFNAVELKFKPLPPDRGGRTLLRSTATGPRPSRAEVIEVVNRVRTQDMLVVATTGFTGRELYQAGDFESNFYMVGSMGCASPMAFGLAVAQPGRRVVCLDGDGAALMRMGALATLGYYGPNNLFHLLLDNGCYDSTGGQPSISPSVDWAGVASASGYPSALAIAGASELLMHLAEWLKAPRLTFAAINTSPGAPKELARPAVRPPQVATRLMHLLASGPVLEPKEA